MGKDRKTNTKTGAQVHVSDPRDKAKRGNWKLGTHSE